MICVLDASAGISLAFKRNESLAIFEHISKAKWIIAPDLYIAETANALWKYNQFKNLSIHDCLDAIDDCVSLVDEFVKTDSLYKEALSFACQASHTVYDSLYIILARRENAKLITFDKKLQKLAKTHHISTI